MTQDKREAFYNAVIQTRPEEILANLNNTSENDGKEMTLEQLKSYLRQFDAERRAGAITSRRSDERI